MKNRYRAFLFLLAFGLGAGASAQDQSAQDAAAGAQDGASQETDINEENYRRFMELRDQGRQRDSAPYAVLAPPSNLEKLGQLPEASQKHLRNQLLEIMLEGGRWQPEDMERDYPFVPSAAATGDASLRSLEAEAWSELVQNYHARESQIYEAGERARSATVPQGERGRSGQATGEAGNPSPTGAPGTRPAASRPAPGGASDTSNPAPREAGETLNALQYLTGNGAAETGAAASREAASSAAIAEAAHSDQEGLESGAPVDSARASSTAESTTAEPAETTGMASNTANAAADQAGADAAQEATDGAADSSANRPEVEYLSPGVIDLRDLKNVKGTVPAPAPRQEEKETDDGSGRP